MTSISRQPHRTASALCGVAVCIAAAFGCADESGAASRFSRGEVPHFLAVVPPPPPDTEPTRTQIEPRGEAGLSALTTLGTPKEERLGTVRRALADGGPSEREAIARVLRDGPADTRSMVLREVAALPLAPEWLGPLLEPLIESAQPELRLAAYAAASSVRTRDCAAILVRQLGRAPRPEAIAIRRALVRMTGRAEFGTDSAAWSDWLQRSAGAQGVEWNRVLLESLATRSDEQARAAESTALRLANELRRAYLLLPTPPERSAMLVGLLGDDLSAVRRAGLQLAAQELASGRVPGEDVAEAVLARLYDSAPDLRALAADLINRLPASPALGPAVNAALREEPDPEAAARLLPAAARWPEPATLPTALMWLNTPATVRDAAIVAVDSFHRAGLLEADSDRRRTLDALRTVPPADLPGPGLRLLFALGDETDRSAVAALLGNESRAVRIRAAESLGTLPGALESIVQAASADPDLFSAAAAAVGTFRPTPAGFTTLSGLPAPSDDARREALLAFASRMSPQNLLTVARSTADLEFREALLLRMRPEPMAPLPGSGAAVNPRVLRPFADAALLLAQTRLDLNQPASALAALDAAQPVLAMMGRGVSASLRCLALVQLNRLPEAESTGAPASAWLEALERSISLPHAPAVLSTIERLFASGLPEADAERLQGLSTRVQAAAGFVGPPSP